MGDRTAIEWTDSTWNPVRGCSKVSQGCKHCYAERVFPRPYPRRKFTDVRVHPERLHMLELTQAGHPRHPLYAPAGRTPQVWRNP